MDELLRVENLTKHFDVGFNRKLAAVSEVSLSVKKGEIFAIVGESGSGKSTLARTIMGAYIPTSGEIFYNNSKISLSNQKARLNYAKNVQMVFQDPSSALNPKLPIRDIVSEGLVIQKTLERKEIDKIVVELLNTVGIDESYLEQCPSELSGGQQQRVGIARALAVYPELLVCDEPISSLDISIQNQIVNLLLELRKARELSYLFISHDLHMVKFLADRVAVMYLGFIIEMGKTEELYNNPKHPYTKLLLASKLSLKPSNGNMGELCATDIDELKSPIAPITNCVFAPRCSDCTSLCLAEKPELRNIGDGQFVRCHRAT